MSSTYLIQVSPDEKAISVEDKGCQVACVLISGLECSREGNRLKWSYEHKASDFADEHIIGTCTLSVNPGGSASLAEHKKLSVGLVRMKFSSISARS